MNGRVNQKDDVKKEAVSMAQLVAKNALLLDTPLAVDTDFTPEEEKELQSQVRMAWGKYMHNISSCLSAQRSHRSPSCNSGRNI